MKSLLYKEWTLAAHPTTFIFLSFGLMLLIPNYPGYVPFIYMCLSVFFLFLSGRENKDVFFTVMLPIRKRDVVKARTVMVGMIELAQIVLSVPFAILASFIKPAGGNLAGIEANIAFYGFVFGMFAVFNAVFIPRFYKTAYRIGMPFLAASGVVTLYYLLVESLVWMPTPMRAFLEATDGATMVLQLPILFAGIAVWIAGWILTYRKAAQNFERVDV